MATVQIADIYEPLTFQELTDERATEQNAFIASGVVVEDARVTAQASAGGRIGEMPNFKPLTQNEPNYSDDDPATSSTPDKISSQKQLWRLAAMNRSWSTMDLARELALSDPVTSINNMMGDYWAIEEEKRIIQSSLGFLADNVANDSSDMLYAIATDDAAAVTDAERISGDAVISASATIGDRQNEFTVIAMHGTVYSQLRKNENIEYLRETESSPLIPFFQGMRVVVDDSLPAIAGVNRITYTSILFKVGVFAEGNGNVEVPSELERLPSTGNGGGQTIIHSRRSKIYHPWGLSFISASVADESATLAELAAAANWNRIYNRKSIGVAFLQTNG